LTIDGDERGLTATMFDPPNGAFLVARRGHAAGTPLGGVGVRTIHPGAGQVRRLWVDPAARGQGVPGPS
jgi:GNAT superfamily N-acetyltransferase